MSDGEGEQAGGGGFEEEGKDGEDRGRGAVVSAMRDRKGEGVFYTPRDTTRLHANAELCSKRPKPVSADN